MARHLMLGEVQIGRRTIFIADHARERYGERSGRHTVGQLREDLKDARWNHTLPGWAQLSLWHRARAEGCIELDEDRVFVVNRNWSTGGDLVAVSYIERLEMAQTRKRPGGGGGPRPTRMARATSEVT
jgi:hypothetical protein